MEVWPNSERFVLFVSIEKLILAEFVTIGFVGRV